MTQETITRAEVLTEVRALSAAEVRAILVGWATSPHAATASTGYARQGVRIEGLWLALCCVKAKHA